VLRMSARRRQVAAGVHQTTPDGLTPQAQLDAIDTRVRGLMSRLHKCLSEELIPALDAGGVPFVGMDDLTDDEPRDVDAYFEAEVFPVLTPLAVDPGHPFPYIS